MKRASGVNIGLVSYINHNILNKCVFIYIEVAYPVDVAHETWGSHSTILLRNTHLEEKKRRCSKKWIVPWGNSSHILSDICTTRLKCQYLPLDNRMFNSAWLFPSWLLLCLSLISLALVILACISYTACGKIGICYYLTTITLYIHYISLESDYNIIEREFNRERDREQKNKNRDSFYSLYIVYIFELIIVQTQQ